MNIKDKQDELKHLVTDKSNSRIIEFSSDFPKGDLAVRDKGSSCWIKWKEATGIIEISTQKELALSIIRERNINLKPLRNLKYNDIHALDLGWTGVRDTDFKHILHLTNLKELDLGCTHITDEAIKQLISFKNLRLLKLANTRLGNPSMEIIKNFVEIEILVLRGTVIDDNVLSFFVNLPRLYMLDIRDTLITKEGKMKLKMSLPSCEILF